MKKQQRQLPKSRIGHKDTKIDESTVDGPLPTVAKKMPLGEFNAPMTTTRQQ
jgi:hypothetical protein